MTGRRPAPEGEAGRKLKPGDRVSGGWGGGGGVTWGGEASPELERKSPKNSDSV